MFSCAHSSGPPIAPTSPCSPPPPHLPLHHPLPPTSHRLCAYATDVAYLLAVSASAAAFGTNFFL